MNGIVFAADAKAERDKNTEVGVFNAVLLGPKIDLHVGVHDALSKLCHPHFLHRRKNCVHVFPMSAEQDKSPFNSFHWGEFVDFGPGRAIVHTARWPVLNRRAWVTDTDDFVYPVVCGRHFLSPDFRKAFRDKWSTTLEKNIFKRIGNMLMAYAHPSCKSILYHTESAVRDAGRWLEEIRAGELGEAYLSKIQLLYPAHRCCPADTMEAKWNNGGPLTVVFCGRDYETKNGRMALEIFHRLAREAPTNRFVYIGKIPEEELKRSRTLLGSVEYHKALSHKQVVSILSRAHIFFHPSKFESLGMVLLEAAAMGMAVITATGGAMQPVAELFKKEGAILVNRESIAQSEEAATFENHLRFVLRHPGVAKRMAYRNFKLARVGKLSTERNRTILVKVYEEALERPAAAPLNLGQIPHRDWGALLRFSSRQLQEEEWKYRRECNVTQERFLL
jgi:glycosyltransferase involved in cell wall biosynthesis